MKEQIFRAIKKLKCLQTVAFIFGGEEAMGNKEVGSIEELNEFCFLWDLEEDKGFIAELLQLKIKGN